MTTLRDIELDYGYMGKGEEILDSFILPCLRVSTSYDRITSFYSFASLLALSEGIQSLYEHQGKMRLVLGVHSIPPEIIEASLRREYLAREIASVRSEIEAGIKSISEELKRKGIATLGWMMEDGLLEVKAAALEGDGLFHPKTLIFSDNEGNRVAAVGSSNETGNGLGSNIEQLMVVCSWESNGAVSKQEGFFNALWNDAMPDATVGEITDELAATIAESLGDSYKNPRKTQVSYAHSAIQLAAAMPSNFFVSGSIPALYQHQERAVIDALSRWPVRVLFADEVGLGKTFEAAATLAFLTKYCGVKRVLILTPKSVLQQWQSELADHFGINAWLYESASKSYVDSNGHTIRMGSSNPIGEKSPSIMLMSAQFARGSGKQKSIFERSGALLPDLLILDEAHSARVSIDLAGTKKKTRIYSMLEEFAPQIPHVILATATPMQKESSEFHSMLQLLGLPNTWKKARGYQQSLELTISDDVPPVPDAYNAGKLLLSTIRTFSPSLSALTAEEKAALMELLALSEDVGNHVIASFIIEHWAKLKNVFIKLHPAHLLTVRNTRRSLSKMGYRFPVRNLHAETIYDSADVQLFYMEVEDYIGGQYFSVERALHPDKKMNVGFVRVSYQQRLASSLYSCRESLKRRFDKLSEIKTALEKGSGSPKMVLEPEKDSGLDDFFYDDAMFAGYEAFEGIEKWSDDVDLADLHHALSLETTSLATLLAKVNRLLNDSGDLKIARAIQLILNHLKKGDRVLVFSRYTDTVDALVELYGSVNGGPSSYGIYTGKKSVVIRDGKETVLSKADVKKGLENGSIPVLFCSDAASEGLNLQAARVLINVDVPWTPARLEQRIGRVARLGQKASEVEVYNVWYPNSVEAKMYTRIDKRLKEMDLAIGEFPQVVADKIRDAILSGSDDDGLDELQEIRNSVQTKALSKLWAVSELGVTTSRHIRNGLIDLCDKELQRIGEDGDSSVYRLVGGGQVSLCPVEGQGDSVSYQSLIDAKVEYDLDGVVVLNDVGGNPAAFSFEGENDPIDHEQIVDLLLDLPVYQTIKLDDYPKMLPDCSALDLGFAVACQVPPKPVFWPPINTEKK